MQKLISMKQIQVYQESIDAKLILNLTFWPLSSHWFYQQGFIATLARDQPKKPAFHRHCLLDSNQRHFQFALHCLAKALGSLADAIIQG